MQNNVIYGAFGQRTATVPGSIARLPENTPTTLQTGLLAQLKVLSDLAELIHDPDLPKEITAPLQTELEKLQLQAKGIGEKIPQMSDNRIFLEVQTELKELGSRLVTFEAEVLHKTGATIEVIEPARVPTTSTIGAIQPVGKSSVWNSPKFWLGLSVGIAALGGLVWWGVHGQDSDAEDEPMYQKMQKVKLRKALPAR